MKASKYLAPALAVLASAICLVGLLPAAFALPGMGAKPLFPLGAALSFLELLGGPLLLLDSGLRAMLGKFSNLQFLVGFAGLFGAGGFLLFPGAPKYPLFIDWIAMSIAISLLAAALRRRWLWALVGGAWAGALLGLFVVATVQDLLSPRSGVTSPHRFSFGSSSGRSDASSLFLPQSWPS